MILYLIIALLSPFVFGLMNILDKYVMAHKVKRPLGYSNVVGVVSLAYSIILALFCDWSGLGFSDFIFPIIIGLIIGSEVYLYYTLLKNEDASNVIGLVYFYPIIVAILSFFIIGEKLSLVAYLGVALVILGSLMLSLRNLRHSPKAIWLIFLLALMVGVQEFLIKISTTRMPAINGVAVTFFVEGILLLLFLISRLRRTEFLAEMRNIRWSFLIESLTFVSYFTLFFAMSGLPATIVASIAAMQPLAVLLFERILERAVGRMSMDNALLPKLVPISLIVAGVALMYLTEMV